MIEIPLHRSRLPGRSWASISRWEWRAWPLARSRCSGKAAGRHSTFGKLYCWCLLALFASATLLSIMRWYENYHLFILAALSFASAWVGPRQFGGAGPIGLGCTLPGWDSLTFCCWLPFTWTTE